MKDKKLKNVKKGIAVLGIMVVLGTPTISSAFSLLPSSASNSSSSSSSSIDFSSILNKIKNQQNTSTYKNYLEQVQNYTKSIDKNMSVEDVKVEIIDKLQELQGEYGNTSAIPNISNKLKNITITSNASNVTELINELTSKIKELINSSNIVVESLIPNEVVDIQATTASDVFGAEYKVKLSANIYYAGLDKNDQPTSDKWALLIQGFQMDGQSMADAVGQMYINQNVNVLAMDIRGFGNSEGQEGMGYLESLDAWDWLTYLNTTYSNKCSEIIVHGISLGGATTLYLSGLEVNGKTIQDQKVIGLVEDCGYTSMTGIVKDLLENISSSELISTILGIANKDSFTDLLGDETIEKLLIEQVGIGFSTVEDFRTHQNALDSLAKCKVPLLIVHGTDDMIVPYKNSDDVYDTAMANSSIPYVQRFSAEGENHAFITLGTQYNVYEGHVKNFIEKAEEIASGKSVEKVSNYKQEEEQKTSVITSLIKALKLLKTMF